MAVATLLQLVETLQLNLKAAIKEYADWYGRFMPLTEEAFLETRLEELSHNKGHITHYIFTDSDVAIMVNDLGQIFQDYPNFHLALTFRNNKAQPLNSGFIAVRGTPDGILRVQP
ncbi:uncharacterized protein LOC132185792 [Corylus avellana]|uniref:uncharacterized protein LOC132185792 n=1 Tax=Corylus avellana TaxID=13451 RepID=UPI00286D51C6|nr:uncharacterized protein LOC132185792 [Corylus avellana]XP_059455568.1 uncharacterized protein LOC132185792 [Corylus avellana]